MTGAPSASASPGRTRYCLPLGALLLVVLQRHLFSPRWSVRWDASDFLLPLMHWFSSAVGAGESPAWIPHLAGGFPAGRDITFGYMGLLHPASAMAFGGSTLAVTSLLGTVYLVSYASTFGIARLVGIGAWPAIWAGLWVVSSGYWLGNGSHPTYLLTVTFTLVIALALLGFAARRPWAPLCAVAGWVLAINGCYPSALLFGGEVVGLLAIILLVAGRLTPRSFLGFVAASALGIAAGVPTLVSAATWLVLTPKDGGFSVAQVMQGSTAPEALKTFFIPLISIDDCKWPGATDITLDRFHLTFVAIPLLFVSLWHIRRWRLLGWTCAALVLVGIDFTLGKNAVVRPWLSEHSALARLSKCLPCDHAWLVPVALAIGLARLLDFGWRRWLVGRPLRTTVVNLVLAADVALVVTRVGSQLIWAPASSPWVPPPVPAYKVVWGPEDQPALDAARPCTHSDIWNQNNNASIPDHFLVWGLFPATVRAYGDDLFGGRRDFICGPGKLRDAQTAAAVPYRLIRYTPTKVHFAVPARAPRDLVWNDVDDGWWSIRVNSTDAKVPHAPSGLRHFVLPPGRVEVVMRYRPKIPMWLGWVTAGGALLVTGAWTFYVRRRRLAAAAVPRAVDAAGAGAGPSPIRDR